MPPVLIERASDIKYINDLSDEVSRYMSSLVINVYNGVARSIGVADPDKLASKPPGNLAKGFLSGMQDIGRRIKGFVGRRAQKSPLEPFTLKGVKIFKKDGSVLTNKEYQKLDEQISRYFRMYGDDIAEEMAVKTILLGMASMEAELQGKQAKNYGKKSYDQIEREKFVGYIPDTLRSAKERFNIDKEVERTVALAYGQVASAITNVDETVREAIRQQVVTAHRTGKRPKELASDLYWMADERPELKNYTAQKILRDWQRVAYTELARLHEQGKMASQEAQARKSIDDPTQAVYYVFNGQGRCAFCSSKLGTIVRHIPLSAVGDPSDDKLSTRGIKDPFTNIAVWQDKNNIGFKQKDWRICTPVHPWCFSDDTEVLTDNGWKLFSKVKDADLIYSMNPETRVMEFVPFVNRIAYHYKGEMIWLKARGYDSLVTPNHKVPIERRRGANRVAKFEMSDAENLLDYREFYIPRTGKWGSTKKLELGAAKLKTETVVALFAWFASEGNWNKYRKNAYRVAISQSQTSKHRVRIRELLQDLCIKFSETSNGFYFYGLWAQMLANNFPDKGSHKKRVPSFIKSLPVKYIEVFLTEYCRGDGHERTRNCFGYASSERVYYTSSKQMVADLCELVLKSGRAVSTSINTPKGKLKRHDNGVFATNRDVFCVRESKSKRVLFSPDNRSKVKQVDYDGIVYCLELSRNHILLTRRNGSVCWSGNCMDTLTRIYPAEQEYDKETRRIKYKLGKEFERFVPKDWFAKIDSEKAKMQERQDQIRKKRMEGVLSADKKKR